jgi:hypothetical protein
MTAVTKVFPSALRGSTSSGSLAAARADARADGRMAADVGLGQGSASMNRARRAHPPLSLSHVVVERIARIPVRLLARNDGPRTPFPCTPGRACLCGRSVSHPVLAIKTLCAGRRRPVLGESLRES